MRYLLTIASVLYIVSGCQSTDQVSQKIALEPFAASYEKIESLQDAANEYDLLIVEPNHYSKGQVDSLKTEDNNVLGYISLGEVNKYRWYYPLMEEQGFLGINENWDSPYLNLADSTTRAILLEKVLANIMAKGFDGLFLDTVDNVAPYTERSHLQPYMLDIIAGIRERHPEAIIIQNAGLFMLDQTHQYIDAVLIEDVATSYNFQTKNYRLTEEQAYRGKVQRIKKYQSEYGKPFLIIDFAKSHTLKDKAISRLDTLDIPYFISTIELNDISKGISSGNK